MEIKIIASLLTAVLLLYTDWIVRKFGVLDSISQSFYRLKRHYNGGFMPYLFTLFIWVSAIPAAYCIFAISDGEWYQFLGFFSAMLLCFVGAAPNYADSLENKVHSWATVIGVLSSQVWIWLTGHWYISAGFLIIALVISFSRKERRLIHPVWWFEMAGFISVYTTIFISQVVV